MKIYYIANARMPTEKAHGIQIAKMAEALIREGVDLTLIIPRRHNPIQSSLKDHYGLRVEVPMVKLPVLDIYGWGDLGFVLGSISFMFFYLCYFLRKRWRGEQFIIYTIDMDQFSFSFVPCLGVPYFSEIHDAKPKGLIFGHFFRRSGGIIAINGLIKRKLMENFGLPAEKILVWPNAIDIEQFTPRTSQRELRARLGLPLGEQIVLYAGKFIEWKGLEILALAAKSLSGLVTFYILGGSREELEQVTGVPFPPVVKILGPQPYPQIPLWYAASDVLVVVGTQKNEYSYYHTSPMKLFEALAAGRPIVAADTPAIRQVVSEREVIFYEPDNPADLADKIKLALAGGPAIEQKITAASHLAHRYSWPDRAKNVLQLLSSAGEVR